MKKIVIFFVILLLGALTMSGCDSHHHSDNNSRPTMLINFDSDGNTVYDGNEQLFYELQEDQKAVVHFKVTAVQGSIEFDVHEKEDENIHYYRGRITESCEFDVVIEKANWYQIYVTANDFHGAYSVNWRTVTDNDK